MQRKIISTFSELSELNRRELFNREGQLKKIDGKLAVSIARQVADGFENIDLRKKPTKAQRERARKYIKEFYENVNSEKTILVRPRKRNRKYYADYSGTSSKLKVYAMPVLDNNDYFTLVKSGKKKRIKRIGEFSSTEFFSFKEAGISKKKLVTKTKEATNELFDEIEESFENETYAVKIKCGKGEYKTLYEDKSPHIEIENWINMYGAEKVKQFCLGFQVYTFNNQEALPQNKLAKKGDKKKKYNNFKTKGKNANKKRKKK